MPADPEVFVRSVSSAAIVLLAALALSACGRRGPLEPPPRADASAVQQRAAVAPLPPGDQVDDLEGNVDAPRPRSFDGGTPTVQSIAPRASTSRPPPITAPKRDFLLDPLLD